MAAMDRLDEIVDRAMWRRDYAEASGELPEVQGLIPPAVVAWRAERARIWQEYDESERERREKTE